MGETRFSRTAKLIGEEGVARLARAHVAVAGLGGVGSHAAEGLCRAGVGRLTLIDPDVVEPSNLNRQVQATVLTLGGSKAEALAARLRTINPDGVFNAVVAAVRRGNLADLLAPDLDAVLDAIDDVASKSALVVYCARRSLPMVCCLGAARRLNPTSVRVAPLGKTRACPLARALRAAVRAEAPEALANVTAVFSEEPAAKHAGPEPLRPLGSAPFVPAAAGMAAAYAIAGILLDRHGERAP
ncbi:MAG TPA: ThiF family adenylyltransferase [Planctomycetota bacterium]|jgi:tRNA A37 threonylcarbamoyladenosine dehydratase|nr:ThiF family adenylyltransferase [Planctomycetota bacterium]OQC20444.1 MAG: tRNA threonylcarbamoyladenosine dehydratase [Planctomycetes bacterium ADurb.Bin069]HNR99084.1 ThiF family adenylyltransferase [Planctomycetota bacterium]HNU26798.1 ThiF family adenylyltransferase [Planctomycetota bacterium]HOE30802.1 ThiF family adenylyltransferase [Planctomycetota bacterium]